MRYDNRKIVLYGTNWECDRFLYNLVRKFGMGGGKIAYCIDDYKAGGNFHGFPIYTLDNAPDLEQYLILVTMSFGSFLGRKQMLEARGLKHFHNFIWSNCYEKNVVLINANCHGGPLKAYLEKSRRFNDLYCIYPIEEIQCNREGRIDEVLLGEADLYIHQDIRPDNRFGYYLSDEYTVSRLKKGCRSLCIPNMVGNGNGIHQTQVEDPYVVDTDGGRMTVFLRDTLIDEAYRNSEIKTVRNVLDYIRSYEFPEDTVQTKFDAMMEKLYGRERNWDIKIVDYIRDNYKTVPMFKDCNHPSDELMVEISRRVGEYLGLDDVEGQFSFTFGSQGFVWPGIKKRLGIVWEEEEIRKGYVYQVLRGPFAMTEEEFVREYIYIFWNKYLD